MGNRFGRTLAVSVLAGILSYAPSARSAEIRVTGPKVVAPNELFSLYVEARNNDVPGQLTRSIDFDMRADGAVFTGPPIKPSQYDFFSDVNWTPVPTIDWLFQPPTASFRGTQRASDSPGNKPFSNVAIYNLQAGFRGGAPYRATANLHDDSILFANPDLSPQSFTNLNGIANPHRFVVGKLGDANCDGVVDANDVPSFAMGLTKPSEYQATGCFMELIDMNGDDAVDGKDIPRFLEAVING